MNSRPIMPLGTSVWLIEKTGLTFEQIAEFTGLGLWEVQAIADETYAKHIQPFDPVSATQISMVDIQRCQTDPNARLRQRAVVARQPLNNYTFSVAGVRYYDGDRAVLEKGSSLLLQPEPANEHDEYAIEILTEDGCKLGYVPRKLSRTISRLLANGVPLLAAVESITYGWRRCIEVLISKDMASVPTLNTNTSSCWER